MIIPKVVASPPFASFNMATRRGRLDDMDATTIALSLCLQLQDIKELAPSFQGKDSSGNMSDEEVAFRSYQSELESRIRAYQSIFYRFAREVQAALSLVMTGPPAFTIRTVPRITTTAVAPTPRVAASTVAFTSTPLAAEASGYVALPLAAASSQTCSPVSRPSSTSSAKTSQVTTLSDSADAEVSDQSKIRLVPSLFHVPLIYYDL